MNDINRSLISTRFFCNHHNGDGDIGDFKSIYQSILIFTEISFVISVETSGWGVTCVLLSNQGYYIRYVYTFSSYRAINTFRFDYKSQ